MERVTSSPSLKAKTPSDEPAMIVLGPLGPRAADAASAVNATNCATAADAAGAVEGSAASAPVAVHVAPAGVLTLTLDELVEVLQRELGKFEDLQMEPQTLRAAFTEFAAAFLEPGHIHPQLPLALGAIACEYGRSFDIRANLGRLAGMEGVTPELQDQHSHFRDLLCAAQDAVYPYLKCLEEVVEPLELLSTCEALQPGQVELEIRPLARAFDYFESCRAEPSGLVALCGQWPRGQPLGSQVNEARLEFIRHVDRLLGPLNSGDLAEMISGIKAHAAACQQPAQGASGAAASAIALPAALPRHTDQQ